MSFLKPGRRAVNLALQGGGAHGAFTWGVLDYLLEDGRLIFEGISGTSAGAMNAVVLAQGLMTGGAEGARAALSNFWNAVADSVPFVQSMGADDGEAPKLGPALKLMLHLTDHFSPSQLNPFDLNPLRKIVAKQVNFEQLRSGSPVKLFIAATHANSGKLRMFRSSELSVDAIMASACLPSIHHPIMIDGEPYWDGGFSANPAVFPLFYHCDSHDILLVLLTPLKYQETPYSAQEIKQRQQDLGFQATFLREMRMFAHLREFVNESWLKLGRFERRVARANFHVIAADELMGGLPAETKIIANKQFFVMLRDNGRKHAKTWLDLHHGAIGKRSTVDLSSLFY
ncbi:MAG: patatin-like phospholipase family protein [Proteobacteria bacterium]|nr:patatin-like phospholipase family protein [Pseudomonadota bacterium]